MVRRIALAFALAAAIGPAAAADSGEEIFNRSCRTCHGGARAADSALGPSLAGIIGRKAGTQPSGVHMRLLTDSNIVWDRDSLRRFIGNSHSFDPIATMPARPLDPQALERLLDYLETAR